MTTPKISLLQLRRLIREEAKKSPLSERIDHKSGAALYNAASKLMDAIDAFREKAPPAAINAVTPHLTELDKILDDIANSPGSYVPLPKKEPKKVSLKAVKDD